MAASVKVVTGTLPQAGGGTVDLTSTSFGTPSAAIIIAGIANTTNNPQADLTQAVAFWDGTNARCHSIRSVDNASLSDTERQSANASMIIAADPVALTYTVSNITDGIRITKNSGTTAVDRYVTVILFSGTTNAYTDTIVNPATGGTDVTAPSFKPNLVFFTTVGDTKSSGVGTNAILSLGVAHNSSTDTVTQGMVSVFSQDNLATSNTGSYSSATYVTGQYYNNALTWGASVSAFDASGFTLTANANTGGDYVFYLALELPNPDDAFVGFIDAATATGTDAHTGLGFQPNVLGLLSSNTTAHTTATDDVQLNIGVTDGTTTASYFVYDQDAVGTNNSASEYSSTNLLNLQNNGDGTTDAVATLSSFDSDGFTLNYSDAAASAKKILVWAIGDSTATTGGSSSNTYLSKEISRTLQGFDGTKKPVGPVVVDWQHPLASKTIRCWPLIGLNDITGLSSLGSGTISPLKYGLGIPSGSSATFGTDDPGGGDKITLFVLADWDGTDIDHFTFLAKKDTWSATDMRWQFARNKDTNELRIERSGNNISFVGAPDARVGLHSYSVVMGNAVRPELYIDGEFIANGNAALSYGSDTTALISIGENVSSSPDIYFAAIFSGALTAAEIAYISANPYAFLKPANDYYWPIGAAAATTALTINADYLSSSASINEPAVETQQVISADYLSSAAAINQPTVNAQQVLTADYLASAQSIPQPTVQAGTPAQTLTADYLASASSVYDAVVSRAELLQADYLASGSAVYDPVVAIEILISADYLASAQSIPQPNVYPSVQYLLSPYLATNGLYYQPEIVTKGWISASVGSKTWSDAANIDDVWTDQTVNSKTWS